MFAYTARDTDNFVRNFYTKYLETLAEKNLFKDFQKLAVCNLQHTLSTPQSVLTLVIFTCMHALFLQALTALLHHLLTKYNIPTNICDVRPLAGFWELRVLLRTLLQFNKNHSDQISSESKTISIKYWRIFGKWTTRKMDYQFGIYTSSDNKVNYTVASFCFYNSVSLLYTCAKWIFYASKIRVQIVFKCHILLCLKKKTNTIFIRDNRQIEYY